MFRATALALLVGATALGCGIDDRPPTWSYLHEAIISPNCTTSSCHSSLSAAAGINLSDREGAYVMLVGAVCGNEDEAIAPPRNFVTPFDPARSKLMYLLRGQEVRNMPPDIPLPDYDVDLVEAWIERGAPCD